MPSTRDLNILKKEVLTALEEDTREACIAVIKKFIPLEEYIDIFRYLYGIKKSTDDEIIEAVKDETGESLQFLE